jgi:2-polyprenyl-6-methoxyphenol hydroxylase-like FAD-dependent oxidoreductase
MDIKNMKIGIIGGGITGLTTALSLSKLGISSIIYEQTKEFNEVGAGIWLQPNAIKILDWLGLKNEIKNQGNELSKMEITNSQLIPFKKIKSEIVQDEEGNRTIAIHRAQLQKTLYSEVLKSSKIELNRKYLSHSVNGKVITIQFDNGSANVDVLLGADGINSRVRKAIEPNFTIRNSEQVCWRGISKTVLPNKLIKLGQEAWGKQIRFGFSQINQGEVYWFAVANSEHLNKAEKLGKKQYIAELYQKFSEVVIELISKTDPFDIHQAILSDLKRIPCWYNDRVCLIGDAAHATTPNMGQGACQGIEDAYYLSQSLSKHAQNTEKAFEEFQLKRRKKVDYVVNTSWQIGKMAHNRIGQAFMKLMMKMTPESVINSQMNKLYAIDK